MSRLCASRSIPRHLITQFYADCTLFLTPSQRCQSTQGTILEKRQLNKRVHTCQTTRNLCLVEPMLRATILTGSYSFLFKVIGVVTSRSPDVQWGCQLLYDEGEADRCSAFRCESRSSVADADGRGRTSLRSDNTVLHVTAETCPDNATHSVSHTGDLISDDVTVMNDVSYGEVICPPPLSSLADGRWMQYTVLPAITCVWSYDAHIPRVARWWDIKFQTHLLLAFPFLPFFSFPFSPSLPPYFQPFHSPSPIVIASPAGPGGARPPNAFWSNSQFKICKSVTVYNQTLHCPVMGRFFSWLVSFISGLSGSFPDTWQPYITAT